MTVDDPRPMEAFNLPILSILFDSQFEPAAAQIDHLQGMVHGALAASWQWLILGDHVAQFYGLGEDAK